MSGEPLPTIPGFQVEALIGRGGMGLVYRALETELGRRVALKVIAPELASEERFRHRFLRESRLAASLDHPNVIPIYSAGEAAGSLYLAMRYVDGSDLRTVLRRDGVLELSFALGIVSQLAGALDAAHRSGLVHRDVKPSNVLLEESGHAYLSDFGLSKRLTGEQTQTGQFVGTLDYLAPEQIRGEPLDGRTDQYALACLLYECLTGTPPFRRETEAETLWAHVQETPPSPPHHAELSPVFARALAKDVEGRYETCAEFANAAKRTPPAPLAERSPRIGRRRRPGRHLALIGVAAVAVLAAGAVAAVLLLSGGGASVTPNSLLAVGSPDGRKSAEIRLPSAPISVAAGSGLVWVISKGGRLLSAVDPSTDKVLRVLDLHGRARGQWAGGGFAIGATDYVSLADSTTLDIVTLPITSFNAFGALTESRTSLFESGAPDRSCAAFLTGSGSRVWYSRGRSLVEIDPQTQLVSRRTTLPAVASSGHTCYGVEFTGGSLFAVRTPDHAVGYLDPASGSFKSIVTGVPGLTALAGVRGAAWAAGFDALWILSSRRLVEVDLRTGRVMRRIAVGPAGGSLTVDRSGVWLVDGTRKKLIRVDPTTGRIAGITKLRYRACCITSGFKRVWLGLGPT